jgi:hypothetical protein
MESKSQKVRTLLIAGKTVDEVAKEAGCSKALVFGVRKVLFPEQVRKYKARSGRKLKRKKLSKADLKRIDAENEIANAKAQVRAEAATKQYFETEMVNSPPHYTVGGIETYDFIKAKGLSYELGNVVKYVARAEWKFDKLEDLRKARWYLDAAIKHEEGTA